MLRNDALWYPIAIRPHWKGSRPFEDPLRIISTPYHPSSPPQLAKTVKEEQINTPLFLIKTYVKFCKFDITKWPASRSRWGPSLDLMGIVSMGSNWLEHHSAVINMYCVQSIILVYLICIGFAIQLTY